MKTIAGPADSRKIFLCIMNLPLGTTPEQLSEHLYSTIGLDVPSVEISTRDTGEFSANAFVCIDTNVLVAFLNHYLEGTLYGEDRALLVEPKIFKNNSPGAAAAQQRRCAREFTRDREQNRSVKINVDQFTVTLPDGKADYTKNGIRKI